MLRYDRSLAKRYVDIVTIFICHIPDIQYPIHSYFYFNIDRYRIL